MFMFIFIFLMLSNKPIMESFGKTKPLIFAFPDVRDVFYLYRQAHHPKGGML